MRATINHEKTVEGVMLAVALAAMLLLAWPAASVWAQAEEEGQATEESDAAAQDAAEDDDGEAIVVDEEAGALVQGGEVLAIVVEAVQGMVQVRRDAEAAFERAEQGMELGIGAAFRTGPRSMVQFRVGPTQVITLDRLGTVEVLEAIEREGVVSTDLGMPYGRTTYEIQSVEDVEHSGQIRSPGATLAVRGSKGFLEDYADRPPVAGSDFGDIAFVNTRGRFVELDPPARIEGDQTAAGEKKIADGTFNRFGLSSTMLELYLLGKYPSGTFEHRLAGFGSLSDLAKWHASVREFGRRFDGGENGGGNDQFLGPLIFDVQWNGLVEDGEFVVNSSTDEILRPGGPTSTGSGGELVVEETSGVTMVTATWDAPPNATYQAFLENHPDSQVNLFVSYLLGELESNGDVIDSDSRFEFVLEPGQSETVTITVPPADIGG